MRVVCGPCIRPSGGGKGAFECEEKKQERGLPEELSFKAAAAAEYDRAFAHVTMHFMLFLLRAAHVAPGMRALDIATSTGLSAEAALAAVGPSGHVPAADLSPAMVEKASERFGKAANVLVSVEDAQALSFSDGSFDAVVRNLGLMFFPDPVRACQSFVACFAAAGAQPSRSIRRQSAPIITKST